MYLPVGEGGADLIGVSPFTEEKVSDVIFCSLLVAVHSLQERNLQLIGTVF